ncbi:aminoglycoside adenylyltransferase domain-containing protein [Phenylobacterium sp.]|uniref:nucleotidyltransferase domain-containing protein n=1 Tax=Phenylobacterium sp. TaxID=1871053 RepID=UPI0030F4B129
MTQSHTPAPAGATPYADLNGVLHQLVSRAKALLGDNFVGAYLQGSFAVGDADEQSDVDFLIVTARDVSLAEQPALQAMHAELFKLASPWAQHLEGSYAPAAVIRRWSTQPRDPVDEPRAPGWADPGMADMPARAYPFLYLNNGADHLVRSEHDNSQVVRWCLREKGIALAGPQPGELVDAVTPEALRTEIRTLFRRVTTLWLGGTIPIDANWLQAFIVTQYCRMLHSLETGTVTSKKAASAWAKGRLDPKWSGLIDRSWTIGRSNLATKLAPADPEDVIQTLAFVRYAVKWEAMAGAASKGAHGASRSRWQDAGGRTRGGQAAPSPIRPGGRGRRG